MRRLAVVTIAWLLFCTLVLLVAGPDFSDAPTCGRSVGGADRPACQQAMAAFNERLRWTSTLPALVLIGGSFLVLASLVVRSAWRAR